MSAQKICPQCGTEYPLDVRFCQTDGTPLRLQDESGDLVGSIVADRYHIMRKLGEGGMGQVYLAEHVKMGRKSALKVMHPGMVKDVDAISRFNREAANASRISHPNVAAVYDFGETPDGIIYLAMEFVDGPPLTKIIETQGALPPKRAAEMVRQAAEALAVAHDMGIVHRDLKPDNIMVAKTRDGGDLVKVVDFGIAKAAGNEAQKVTKTGLVVGTPEYMSPEQLSGDKLDGRSDIYSLGLVAFNMLTGTLPFPSESAQESMIMRLTDRPKTLAEMKVDVAWPPEVQAVMDRALERDASKRYQTAAEFGRDLVRAIDRMPETVAAELGTQVLESVPATRVASAPAASRTAPMAAADAAPVGAPASASPAKRKTMAPMIGVAAAVVVLGGGGIAWKMSHATAARASDSTTAQVGANSATQSGQQISPNPVTQSAAPAPQGAPASGTETMKKPSAPATQASASNVASTEKQLATLELQALGDPDGTAKKLEDLFPRLTTPALRAHAHYVYFRVYASNAESDKACGELADAIKLDARYRGTLSTGLAQTNGCK